MLLHNQIVTIKWHPTNIKYYESKGYVYTKCGDSCDIDVMDLAPNSHIKIKAICDDCGKIYEVSMTNYTRSINNSGSAVCKNCKANKTKTTLITKYGVNTPSKIDDFVDKTTKTCLEKYGVSNPMKDKEIQNKNKSTLLQHYGVEHPIQNEEIKLKIKQTCLDRYGVENVLSSCEYRQQIKDGFIEKYGVDNPAKVPEIVEKAKKTCMKRYGGQSSQASAEIRAKSWASMTKHGTIPVSRLEKEIITMLQDIYGVEHCNPSFILDRICLDCLLMLHNTKIDIEVDGWYWHKNKQEKDANRDYYTIKQGYKILRIITNGSLPTNQQIIDGVNYLLQENHHKYKIILDNIDI